MCIGSNRKDSQHNISNSNSNNEKGKNIQRTCVSVLNSQCKIDKVVRVRKQNKELLSKNWSGGGRTAIRQTYVG